MTPFDLRERFKNETGIESTNSQGEPDVDYVDWLELKIISDNKKLKADLQKAYTEIWKTQIYPLETKGKPKGDDILKKYFPFLKIE